MSVQKTMLLISADWDKKKSFRLIPISKDCPYSEGIFDLNSKVLVLFSCLTKESFHMLAKLDENGDPIPTKNTRPNGKRYKEQRVSVETFNEYYISEKEEIENLIDMIAINSDLFEYKKYLVPVLSVVPE